MCIFERALSVYLLTTKEFVYLKGHLVCIYLQRNNYIILERALSANLLAKNYAYMKGHLVCTYLQLKECAYLKGH